MFVFFLIYIKHGKCNVQKNKKKNETKRKKKPKKKNVFVFCLNLLQDAYIPFLIFLFEEKRKEI